MVKKDLVNAIAEKTGVEKKTVELVYAALTETVAEQLKNGEKIQLIGFGTFEAREYPARKVINPQTREPMEVPASKKPVFTAGKLLKDALAD